MVVESKHLLGIGQELKSHLCQGYGTGGTVKKLGTQFGFQALNLPGYGRLGHGKPFSCLGIVQRLGQGSEALKLLGIHAITSSRIYFVICKIMIAQLIRFVHK